jgi:hypothetical protein
MQMILTRRRDEDYSDPDCDYKFSNIQFEKYFDDHWDLLANP